MAPRFRFDSAGKPSVHWESKSEPRMDTNRREQKTKSPEDIVHRYFGFASADSVSQW
jgi:hypothetical protein